MPKQTQNEIEESQNPLGVSDADFLESTPPPVIKEEESSEDLEEEELEEEAEEEDTSDPEGDEEEEESSEDDPEESDEEDEAGDPPAKDSEEESDGEEEDDSDEKPKKKAKKAEAEEDDDEGEITLSASEHKELLGFKALIDKPIRANGKDIKLNSPEELLKLAQQGADYTRKLQALVPYRKTAMMLENAGIKEDRLSLLIDVSKGEKGAINKLLKDLKIDSLDLDTDSEVDYTAKDHRVTDEEVTFHEALDDMTSDEEGRKSLKIFNGWDTESQNALYGQPALMRVMHEQRQNGIFDVIDSEINRKKALGELLPSTPYLEAYKKLGDEIAAKGGFNHLNAPESESDPKPTAKGPLDGEQPAPKRRKVLDTRKGAAKTQASKGDGANKARANRGSKRKTSSEIQNPLGMADDEFLEQFKDRL